MLWPNEFPVCYDWQCELLCRGFVLFIRLCQMCACMQTNEHWNEHSISFYVSVCVSVYLCLCLKERWREFYCCCRFDFVCIHQMTHTMRIMPWNDGVAQKSGAFLFISKSVYFTTWLGCSLAYSLARSILWCVGCYACVLFVLVNSTNLYIFMNTFLPSIDFRFGGRK